jgi:hypothetical protein
MVDRIATVTGKRPDLSDGQKQRFAALLDRLLRRRIFDSRLAVIETMDSICVYLRSEKAIEKETSRLTMELHDIWAYGYNQERLSGKEIKCSPIAYASFNRSRFHAVTYRRDSIGPFYHDFPLNDPAAIPANRSDSSFYDNEKVTLTYGGRLTARFSRPYRRYFQLNGSLECKGTMNTTYDSMRDQSSDNYFRGTFPNLSGKCEVSWRWFPSIRSTLLLWNRVFVSRDYAYRYKQISGETYLSRNDYIIDGGQSYIEATSGAQMEYFISPRCSYYLYGQMQYLNGSRRMGVSVWNVPYSKALLNFSCGGYLSYALF